jgi:hypothetical protein
MQNFIDHHLDELGHIVDSSAFSLTFGITAHPDPRHQDPYIKLVSCKPTPKSSPPEKNILPYLEERFKKKQMVSKKGELTHPA